jgi:hypothetical protein
LAQRLSRSEHCIAEARMNEHPKDWADAATNGADIRAAADRVWADQMKVNPKRSWRENTITAAALQKQKFPPVGYVVSDLIPEGLSMLCGRPKIGKSWAALEVALAVASGGECFGGRSTEQGDVLYAALEDNRRRLQRRIDKLISPFSTEWPERLTLTTSWLRLDKGGVPDIAQWIKGADKPRLVILDTLAGVKPIRNNSGYAEDYDSLTHLHRLANETGIGILVLHHTRKLEADDPLDTISGTLGLAGCADTALVFVGSSQGMTLYIRGRDIEEAEHAVTFDKVTCRWSIVGAAAEVRMSDTRKVIIRVLKEARDELGPSEIAAAAGLKENAVKQRLINLVSNGDVQKRGRGLYAHPDTPVTSVTS